MGAITGWCVVVMFGIRHAGRRRARWGCNVIGDHLSPCIATLCAAVQTHVCNALLVVFTGQCKALHQAGNPMSSCCSFSVPALIIGRQRWSLQSSTSLQVVPEQCKYEVLSTKVEITLAKADTLQWVSGAQLRSRHTTASLH